MRLTAVALIVAAALGIPFAVPAQQPAPGDPREAACRQLIERSRMTDKGQELLQRLMRTTEAPDVMDRLINLANSVGGGDVVAGLTRMVETVERVEKAGTPSKP